MYVCIYACMNLTLYVYVWGYILPDGRVSDGVSMCACVYVFVCMYMCMYVCVCMCVGGGYILPVSPA